MARWLDLDKIAQTKLGGIFVGSDDDEAQAKDSEAETPQSSTLQPAVITQMTQSGGRPSAVFTPTMAPTSTFVAANIDPVVLGKIQAIANNADQVSYRKFLEIFTVQKSLFPNDESTAYRASLGAAKAAGYPVLEVIRGIDVIIRDLSSAESEMKKAVPAKISERVGSRQLRIAEIQRQADLKRTEIAQLQERIKSLSAEVAQLAQTEQHEISLLQKDEQAVNQDAEKFQAAIEAVRNPYLMERQKIELHGKGL